MEGLCYISLCYISLCYISLLCIITSAASGGDLDLHLDCNTPAALHSTVAFRALVTSTSGATTDKEYRYEFWDDQGVTSSPHSVVSRGTAMYSTVYNTDPGLYEMTVRVFPINGTATQQPLIKRLINFMLTDRLNGVVEILRGGQILPDYLAVLSPGDNVTFVAHVVDRLLPATQTYHWTMLGPDTNVTSQQEKLVHSVTSTGQYVVAVVVKVKVVIDKLTFDVEGNFSREFVVKADGYTLTLDSSSPAVLNSKMTFRAVVTSGGRPVTDVDFRFQWWDDHSFLSLPSFTTGLSPALYTASYERNPGEYRMTVSVSFKNMTIFETPLATKVIPFHLTDKLSGSVVIAQDQSLNLPDPVYISTSQSSTLIPVVHDDTISVRSHWTITGPVNITSNQSALSGVFAKSGDYLAHVTIQANTTTTEGDTVSQSGEFSRQLHARDPIRMLGFDGVTEILVGTDLTGNVTCQGSGPFSMCWSLAPGYSSAAPAQACIRIEAGSQCHSGVTYRLNSTGEYRLYMNVRNDVSQVQQTAIISVHDKSLLAVSVSLPFLILFIIAVIIIVVLIYKLRQKSNVEVADFNFHGHTLKKVPLSVRLHTSYDRLKSKLKVMTMSRRHSTNNHGNTRYGSVQDGNGHSDDSYDGPI